MTNPVIVMALYDIGRDNWKDFNLSYNTYLWWMRNTLSIDANFVIYTEEKFKDKIKEYRLEFDPDFSKTKLIIKPLEELEYYKDYYEKLSNLMSSKGFEEKIYSYWQGNHPKVPELEQPLYNIIMFNKLSFLKDTKDNNYFNGDSYIWADAGGLRNDIEDYRGEIWPDTEKLSQCGDKITFFSHTPDFTVENNEFHSLSQIRNIQGTAFIVPKTKLDEFVKAFKETVDECIEDGYIGSDEKVLDITYLKSKENYKLIHCSWREYFDILKRKDPVKKNKVLLDLGYHQGQGLRRLIDELGVNDEWEVHSFEPNPLLVAQLSLENTLSPIDVNIYDSAVWVHDGESNFKQYGEDGTGQGSLLEETHGDEHYHDYHDSQKVKTIDFYKFLNSFQKDQDIYIKMDIEWSEYQVIENMLTRGWPENIKQIRISWHGTHNDFIRKKSEFLTEQIRAHNCELLPWY